MVGQNIGKYRVLDRIGRGGMGTVYRAMDETLHREVAIKVLNAELNDPEVAKRFRAEAITVARLSHPGIATIYELFQYEGQWLMVMEFVRGETLEHMVDRMGPLSPQRSAELCMQALAALAHAHSMGVVHRDLKPANMMITETGAVKIMDFGIARVAGTEHLTNAGFMMGTPAYMAPEQVRGDEIDARADLYSMGVVFYRLTTAKLPFKGETPFAMAQSQVNDPPTPAGMVRPDLPPWVEPIIARSLSKKSEERFQSAAEFHEAFARCLAGLPFTTVYGATSNSQTEILATPGRPMPTGSLSMRGPGTGSLPAGVIAGPAASSAHPASETGTAGGAVPAGPELMTMPAGMPATSPVPVSTPAAAAPKPAAATVKKDTKTKSDAIALGAIALVILGLVGGGAYWYRSRHSRATETPPAAPAEPAPGGTATIDPTAVPPPTPVTPEPLAPPTPGAPGAAAGGAAIAPGAPGAVPPPGGGKTATPAAGAIPGGAPSPTTPAGTTPAGATPVVPGVPNGRGAKGPGAVPPPGTPPATPVPANDPLVAFTSVKLYVVSGNRANDRDVLINFANGQITVLPKNGGEAMGALPYDAIAKATYVKARDPKWDTALPSPPEGLDVGSFLRQSRHWLVIQTSTGFTILRLEDSNASRMVDTFQSRTGKPVDRPRTSDK